MRLPTLVARWCWAGSDCTAALIPLHVGGPDGGCARSRRLRAPSHTHTRAACSRAGQAGSPTHPAQCRGTALPPAKPVGGVVVASLPLKVPLMQAAASLDRALSSACACAWDSAACQESRACVGVCNNERVSQAPGLWCRVREPLPGSVACYRLPCGKPVPLVSSLLSRAGQQGGCPETAPGGCLGHMGSATWVRCARTPSRASNRGGVAHAVAVAVAVTLLRSPLQPPPPLGVSVPCGHLQQPFGLASSIVTHADESRSPTSGVCASLL